MKKMYVDFFYFEFLCKALAASKTFKDGALIVLCKHIVDFVELNGGQIPKRYKIFQYNVYVSKTKIKIRVPGCIVPKLTFSHIFSLLYLSAFPSC